MPVRQQNLFYMFALRPDYCIAIRAMGAFIDSNICLDNYWSCYFCVVNTKRKKEKKNTGHETEYFIKQMFKFGSRITLLPELPPVSYNNIGQGYAPGNFKLY